MPANLASDWRLVYAIIGSAIAGASTFLYYIAADVILADSGGPTRPIGLISGYCAFLAAIGVRFQEVYCGRFVSKVGSTSL